MADEAALYKTGGYDTVMAGQFEHILDSPFDNPRPDIRCGPVDGRVHLHHIIIRHAR
ncbi:hypothetical protein [Nocardia rhamnosiphila]|uniref:hypothetical protein n=1 Tax=Nocardia rhamnosiphila TaxID=426716 RepID=UPI0033EA2E4A